MIIKSGMPNGGQPPVFQDEHGLLAALFYIIFLRSAGFNMMSLVATGKHPSLFKASSP